MCRYSAEYRRKRRQRRGSLSGNADEDGLGGSQPQDSPRAQLDAIHLRGLGGYPEGTAEAQHAGHMSHMMHANNGAGGGSALFSPAALAAPGGHLMMDGMMHAGGGDSSFAGGISQGVVIVLDAPNSDFGNFYGEKLETEFGLRVIFAANAADLQSNMLAQSGAVVGVLFAETTMDPETVGFALFTTLFCSQSTFY